MLMCQYANWLRYYSKFPYGNRYAIMPNTNVSSVSIARYYTE